MWSLHVVTWPNYMSCEPVPVPLLTFIIMSRSHAVLMWNLGRMAKLLKRPIGWSEWPLSSTWQFSQSKSWSQLRADLHGDNVPIFLDTAVPMTLVQALMSNILGDPGWIRLAGQHHIILINNQYNIDIYIYAQIFIISPETCFDISRWTPEFLGRLGIAKGLDLGR